ncbi:hypothetical protein BY458DRAFT_514652 [Sporodiniella umbellata]|nr:hypothetical protein BY458DRAFT_514652 [Sporodiniella umbellata]
MSQSPYKNSLHSPLQLSLQDISIKEILKRHSNDPELLKCILTAKSEEDKKKTARDVLKAEKVRIQLRHIDMELAREQYKSRYPTRYEPYQTPPAPATYIPSTPHSATPLQFSAAFLNTHIRHSVSSNESHKVRGALKTQTQGKNFRPYHATVYQEDLKKPVLPSIDRAIEESR